MTPHLWKLEYNRNHEGVQIIYVSYINIMIFFSEFVQRGRSYID
jgi:hypothetical protein